MTQHTWQSSHLAQLEQRLALVRAQPDGTLDEIASPLHRIRVVKQHHQIAFYFVDQVSGELYGPMSRLDLARPLALLADYTQAAMLALLWRPQPAHVCVLGLAGGRLTLLFYHYFARTMIHNVDIDPTVAEVATRFFGVTFDARNMLAVADARAFLQTHTTAYDTIIMDAFRDDSDNLNHLATREFYALCKERLLRGGVLCANVLKADPRFWEKVKTFLASFAHCFIAEQKHGLVLFGNDTTRFTRADLVRRANDLQHTHGFVFPFVEQATAVRAARSVPAYSRAALQDIALLVD